MTAIIDPRVKALLEKLDSIDETLMEVVQCLKMIAYSQKESEQ